MTLQERWLMGKWLRRTDAISTPTWPSGAVRIELEEGVPVFRASNVIRDLVCQRAGGKCEYCHTLEAERLWSEVYRINRRGGTVMGTVRVRLAEKVWQDLVLLGQEEKTHPADLLEQAVRNFSRDKKGRSQFRGGLQENFGVWKDRDDIQSDSIVIVDEWRKEWDEREQRLGLA